MHDTCIFNIEKTQLIYSAKMKQRLDISYFAVPFSFPSPFSWNKSVFISWNFSIVTFENGCIYVQSNLY